MNESLRFLRMMARTRTIPMFQQVGFYRVPTCMVSSTSETQGLRGHRTLLHNAPGGGWSFDETDAHSMWGEGVKRYERQKCKARRQTEAESEREGRCCFCILDFSGDHVCGPRREWLPAAVGARPMAGRQSVGQSSPECAHVCVSCCADAVGLCVRVVSVYGTRRVL